MRLMIVIMRILVLTLLFSSAMYWSWNPDTMDTHGFFLFWGWMFSMLVVALIELRS